jgi:hypothetical protein
MYTTQHMQESTCNSISRSSFSCRSDGTEALQRTQSNTWIILTHAQPSLHTPATAVAAASLAEATEASKAEALLEATRSAAVAVAAALSATRDRYMVGVDRVRE